LETTLWVDYLLFGKNKWETRTGEHKNEEKLHKIGKVANHLITTIKANPIMFP